MRRAAGPLGILLDIEGTTTPIDFVTRTLFPHAARALEAGFITRAAAEAEVRAAVAELEREYTRELAQGGVALPAFGDGTPYALRLMREDRKSTGLKALQGLIWQEGYHTGELRGQVFPDVPPALARWSAAGMHLRIFSSGSVLAQRLLFTTTPEGDLTRFFAGFHDTTTGPKQVAASYTTIAGAFGLPADRLLFVSDALTELSAADAAGYHVRLAVRPGNPPVADHGFEVIRSFDELPGGA